MKKKVALALASGGPRGFAFIGAIEELQARGYEITSVSGTSAGALVGGIFAAGGMQAFKEWLYSLDPVKVMKLMDFSISKNYLVKGDKVIRAIKERVPEVHIEDLPIPFSAIATDLFTGEEVVFREGPLFDAIRASISIPSMFRPVKWKGRTLVDGGMVNTFPLNRVQRTPGDILVGFNVNEIDAAEIQGFLDSRAVIANAGDSRVYLLHRHKLRLLTRDDTKVQMFLDAKLLTRQEADTHPDRHVLTQYLGISRKHDPFQHEPFFGSGRKVRGCFCKRNNRQMPSLRFTRI